MISHEITHETKRSARAFSLVEILISILVLGFGLLGLAAVFPVVVSQQRDAANEMRGPSAVQSVKAQIDSTSGLVDWEPVVALAKPPAASGGAGVGSTNQGRWVFDRRVQGGLASHQRLIDTYPNGAIELRGSTPVQLIPATARVFPSVYGSVRPQFAWDIALRRVSESAPLEVAMFVRRLDAGIRVPDGKTLANVLTGEGLRPGGNVAPGAVPLGESPEGANDNARRPSGDGQGDYSRLRELFVIPEHPGGNRNLPIDRFPLRNASKLAEALVGREGQLLLDDLGVVRTVRGFESDGAGRRLVVVDPPFPNLNERSVLYTPQTPAAIEIFTVGGN